MIDHELIWRHIWAAILGEQFICDSDDLSDSWFKVVFKTLKSYPVKLQLCFLKKVLYLVLNLLWFYQ